ncbi:tetratricopeptide repeat protein [Dyella sp. KRB-257]|uniref:tetratricopeptide repeat protein n=1 Tax=Dyella sp. KRB-257 TaxID=3400915 RepID=UPI003C127CC9
MSVRRSLRLLVSASAIVLGGCALFAAPPPPTPARAPRPNYDLVASIRAAGAREQSIIDVTPLRDPAVATLQEGARADERAGRYPAAAAKLDQALRLSPESPDLLQDRAEIAVRMRDFPLAEKLAQQSWSLGPRLGPLCARNWQTVVEMRLQADDRAGAASARKWMQTCHKAGVNRY